MTNYSGFYRYRTKDIIEIVRNDKEGVFFEFCFRRNLNLNIAGEKTSSAHLKEAMEEMKKILPNIFEYKLGAKIINNVGSYYLFICLHDKNEVKISHEEIVKKFDEFLKKANHFYKLIRLQKILGDPKVILMNTKEYYETFQISPVAKGHNKAKILISQQQLDAVLERMEKTKEKLFVK